MLKLGIALVSFALLTSNPQTAYPQTIEQNSPITEKQYRDKVLNLVFGSCNKTAPIKDARTRSTKCKCYANSYVNRYTTQSLISISEWTKKNQKAAGIVPIMMNPEAISCKITE